MNKDFFRSKTHHKTNSRAWILVVAISSVVFWKISPSFSIDNVCNPTACANGGTCVPYYGIALCKCTPEYTGAHCSGNLSFHEYHYCTNMSHVSAYGTKYSRIGQVKFMEDSL